MRIISITSTIQTVFLIAIIAIIIGVIILIYLCVGDLRETLYRIEPVVATTSITDAYLNDIGVEQYEVAHSTAASCRV